MSGVDRISHLPDEIIHHILSFLRTTKLRAQTSALSKRWREIWTYHPSLRIIVADSGGGDIVAGVHYVSAVVSCVNSFRAPSLHQLSVDLWFPSSDSADHCAAASYLLLQFAGRRSVRDLRIFTFKESTSDDPYGIDEDDSPIPDSLYCCTSLVDLEVYSCTFPMVPVSFNGFRCLKYLDLDHVTIDTDELGYLLGCCNRLETVRLAWCRGFRYLAVGSRNLPQLTDLNVHFCEDLKETTVEATHLDSIFYEGNLQRLEFYSSPVLYEAALCQGAPHPEKAFNTQQRFMSIMFAIENVSVLVANDCFYQFVFSEPGVLYNLQELTLYIDQELTESALKVLITNIGECPMLETLDMFVRSKPDELYQACSAPRGSLTTDHTSSPCRKCSSALLKFLAENGKEDWRDLPELVPNRSLLNLKTVIMREFLGSKNEMHLVKFLLGNGVALEKFFVFDFPKRNREELEDLFAPFPRASPQVQLKLSLSENDFRLMSHSWLFAS